MNAAARLPLLAKFGHVTSWIFDLDNTLYPPDSGLWPAIEDRITLFLIEHSRARRRLGAGVAALLLPPARHDACAASSTRTASRRTRSSISSTTSTAANCRRTRRSPTRSRALPGRKLIFTNGSRNHALATIEQLGLGGLFEDTFDIVAAGLVPKPRDEAYDAFFRAHDVDPAHAAMFEDIAKNLAAPRARGMTTVLVTAQARPDSTIASRFDREAAAGLRRFHHRRSHGVLGSRQRRAGGEALAPPAQHRAGAVEQHVGERDAAVGEVAVEVAAAVGVVVPHEAAAGAGEVDGGPEPGEAEFGRDVVEPGARRRRLRRRRGPARGGGGSASGVQAAANSHSE